MYISIFVRLKCRKYFFDGLSKSTVLLWVQNRFGEIKIFCSGPYIFELSRPKMTEIYFLTDIQNIQDQQKLFCLEKDRAIKARLQTVKKIEKYFAKITLSPHVLTSLFSTMYCVVCLSSNSLDCYYADSYIKMQRAFFSSSC